MKIYAELIANMNLSERRTADCSKAFGLRGLFCNSLSEAEKLKSKYVVIMVTTADREEAEKISQNLLEQKLIVCANIIGPFSSSYWWKGKIDHANENILLMKTRKELFGKVEKKVRSLHGYEVPEIIAVQIVDCSKRYLEWVDSVLSEK